ncbi:MAG: HAMP domain-containing histidine kinase [Anaerolineae bacterium]|nr:HAMP domain-containing histidine kinase [Anaerolineae bacterium]
MSIDFKTLVRRTFPEMDDEAITELLALARINTYPPGVVLCTEGAYEGIFYIIAEGQAQVTKRFLAKSGEHLVRNVGAGDFVGEMELIGNMPRAATVRTLEETTVLELNRGVFEELLSMNPAMALAIVRGTIDRLRDNDRMTIRLMESKHHEVAQAYHKLAEQERLRSEFLTTLAHELRTPLTSAKGFVHMIQTGSLEGSSLKMAVERAAANIDQVVTLVNDLLFVQEVAPIKPALKPTHVEEVVFRVVDEHYQYAAEQGLRLVIHVAPDLPAVMGDSESLAQAFRALLHNAIKFSPGGGDIRVSVYRSNHHIEIAFADPGVGIPEEFIQDGLFERFVRRDSVNGYVFGGMGLGLPIARHLVEAHGGRIRVASQVGQGSTFTVCIPISPEPGEVSEEAESANDSDAG